MIGNDIVDWAQAKRESNWQRKGFLAKIFTDQEQHLINKSSAPERMVWTLWSLKESVYKANLRTSGNRIFAPKKIECQISNNDPSSIGGIAFYDTIYQVRASLTHNYVSSVAFQQTHSPDFQEVIVPFNGVSYAHQHTRLHEQLRHDCAAILSVPLHTVCIRKNEKGVPTVHIANELDQSLTIPISLSHHGHYGAYLMGRC